MKESQEQTKTLLITGGAGFIGRATAKHFLSQGTAVILTDIRAFQDVKELLEKEFQETKGTWTYIKADATKSEEVQKVVNEGLKWSPSGHIHYLFNNAGIQGDFTPCHLHSDQGFSTVMRINVESVFLFLKYVSVAMKEQKTPECAIVNTASRAGMVGPPNMIAYAASKGAIIAMTKTAAKDLAPYNIRVNSISPALVGDCEMWRRQVKLQSETKTQYFPENIEEAEKQFINSVPLRRTASLEEVAQCVRFLLSPASSYVSGQNLSVSGGAA